MNLYQYNHNSKNSFKQGEYMRFKELFQRALLVIFAPWAWLISIPIFLSAGFSIGTANGLAIFIALVMVYKAIIPWDRSSITVGDVIDKWKNIGK